MCFFPLAEQAYLEQNDPFSTLKILICRKCSFQKQTQFSQGNSLLDALPLTQMVSFERHMCFVNSAK
jgi:hypothetical protein